MSPVGASAPTGGFFLFHILKLEINFDLVIYDWICLHPIDVNYVQTVSISFPELGEDSVLRMQLLSHIGEFLIQLHQNRDLPIPLHLAATWPCPKSWLPPLTIQPTKLYLHVLFQQEFPIEQTKETLYVVIH